MKRTILTSLCALFALGLFAQVEKTLIIHKTDGTKVEYFVEGISYFSFRGKAIVNDDDYTQIADLALALEGTKINIDITAAFTADDPYATDNRYGTGWGILYSTSPDVTIENGTLVELNMEVIKPFPGIYLPSDTLRVRLGESVLQTNEGCKADLEYNTTYYFRSFVRREANNDIYEEEYFYSKEKSVSVGKPSMNLYNVSIIPAYAAESGYIFPTEEAWAAFDEQYPYFTLSRGNNKELVLNHWNEYLTPERINTLKAQCSVVYDCAEGMLYLLDNIGEDFCNYVLSFYEGEQVLAGYSEQLDENAGTVGAYVECDASWNVPDNSYWKYTADTRKNPSIEIPLTKWMLANYLYNVEITLAPNTQAEETLPSKVKAVLSYGAGGAEILATEFETSVSECSVITVDSVDVTAFTDATLSIASVMNTSNRSPDKNKFLPILRVAQIKITPCRKENAVGE